MDATSVSHIQNRNILYCVLNWGLGHASRSIPLIQHLAKDNAIHIASDGEAGVLLRKELSGYNYHKLPSYGIHYKYSSMHLNMLVQFPKIVNAYTSEKSLVQSICSDNKIDLIISDHRYGCRHADIESIFLGHQLNIIGSATATKINKLLISKFDACWVPDYADRRLSGDLANADGLDSVVFIGPLSRMEQRQDSRVYDIAVVLSGPEPKRSHLESTLLDQLKDTGLKCCLVRGTKKEEEINPSGVEVHDLLDSQKLNEIMSSARLIICRSGYSSLMDLEVLEKPALIIPTKGQKEQEYLAKHYSKKAQVITQTMNELSIISAYQKLIED